MTTSTPRSPRHLFIAALLLAVAGLVLLAGPPRPSTSASPTPPPGAATKAPSAPSPAGHRAVNSAPTPDPTAATPATSAGASALPPHGEGLAGDGAIQQALQDAWPADLPAADERQLLNLGRALLRADATGTGRTRWSTWSTYFGDPDPAIAPAFATARFRIQAAIARRDARPSTAVVHLVWAGTDRGGTYTDGRITDLHFTRTLKRGEQTWTPQPRI
ncbi:hypothetical protein [Streptomyces sp. NPDC057199]|uniref:hypothetical protein n=1 Tax=Streptomyces sp. NPDC057199 TaxID=3346047 RepID=UPI00363C8686